MDIDAANNLLTVYTLDEILDYNQMTAADVVMFLYDYGAIDIPDHKPLDLENGQTPN